LTGEPMAQSKSWS